MPHLTNVGVAFIVLTLYLYEQQAVCLSYPKACCYYHSSFVRLPFKQSEFTTKASLIYYRSN
ncbi:hypothetical protein HMPREF1475_01496 [Hoylesella oralis HGA0225]|uniref:hypothetical protein n=1 Tax=Hoylesella oralis TaxID=28134 RepID=UPI000353256B|nr:hypothetical protein [Hoylesella oralis]EPH16382.1 hypothetical protein HMPREF1475_01496 [Hoylesella oralis HGA0225]SHF40665.1 hypothetical protein SAMN05444288_0477 [Hoylesella oralis]